MKFLDWSNLNNILFLHIISAIPSFLLSLMLTADFDNTLAEKKKSPKLFFVPSFTATAEYSY